MDDGGKNVPQNHTNSEEESATKFILIGDDDTDDQLLLRDVFSGIDRSFRLLFVDTGEQVFSALGKLRDNQQPCLILLYYNMPGMNGAEILKELNKNTLYEKVPKIIWSTSAVEKYRNKCL